MILISVYRIKWILLMWFIFLVICSIMSYHLFTGRTLVNPEGKLDLLNGQPNQINYQDIYHSFVFTTLIFYDEEWDYLMFKEYVGSGVGIVIWKTILMFIGYILFTRYVLCALSREINILLLE